jgi:ParB family chromosome partitioning protein
MKTNRVLGKGLSALIQGAEDTVRLGDKQVKMVRVVDVAANPLQPRKSFDDNSLQELADSIARVGILQPVLVRRLAPGETAVGPLPKQAGSAAATSEVGTSKTPIAGSGPRYFLVAGERRVRAARLAGVEEIPAIVCSYKETEALKIALLENIQREDLGPIEEATAYRDLLDAYGATQDELAEMLGKNRSSIANLLRLLTLEPEIQALLQARDLTRGHAKALLGLPSSEARVQLARLCRSRGLSVRECERRVQVLLRGRRRRRRQAQASAERPEVKALRERAEQVLGSPVRIERDAKTGKGALTIRFFSDTDLERLLEIMGVDTNLS